MTPFNAFANSTIFAAPKIVNPGVDAINRNLGNTDNLLSPLEGFLGGAKYGYELNIAAGNLLPGELKAARGGLQSIERAESLLGPIGNAVAIAGGLTSDTPIKSTFCAGVGILGADAGIGIGAVGGGLFGAGVGAVPLAMAGSVIGGIIAEKSCEIDVDAASSLFNTFAPQEIRGPVDNFFGSVDNGIRNAVSGAEQMGESAFNSITNAVGNAFDSIF